MEKKICLTGVIVNGKLAVNRTPSYEQFLLDCADGNVIITIEEVGMDGSAAQIAYLRKVLVPMFVRGFYEKGDRVTSKKAEYEMLSMCPSANKQEVVNGKWIGYVKPLDEMTMKELSDVIENLKQILAQEFSIFVE